MAATKFRETAAFPELAGGKSSRCAARKSKIFISSGEYETVLLQFYRIYLDILVWDSVASSLLS